MSPTRKPSKSEETDKTDYLAKRSRNNEAVRRSREKARMKAKETHERVSQLKQENEQLEERIKLLTKELTFLKDIFLAHAGEPVVFNRSFLREPCLQWPRSPCFTYHLES